MNACQVEGCTKKVSKPGHLLCLEHWKAERNGQIKRCDKCQRWHDPGSPCRAKGAVSDPDDAPDEPGYLSSTKIGKHFGISSVKVNLILAELGWIEKYGDGWVPTDRGNAIGANVREGRKRRGNIPCVADIDKRCIHQPTWTRSRARALCPVRRLLHPPAPG